MSAPGRLVDPLQAAQRLSLQVERPGARRAVRLAAAGACGDALTLYVSGCNLRCAHCWAGRDLEDPVRRAPFVEYARLAPSIALHRQESRLGPAARAVRLSGGEPVLSERFFELLEALLALPGRIFIETNGVLLGENPGWCRRLAGQRARVHLKVSLKAGTAAQYERLTGVHRSGWEATWACVEALHAHRASFDLNALSMAPELFSAKERAALLGRLSSIGASLPSLLEEERFTPYPQTVRRMRSLSRRRPPGARREGG